MNKEERLALKKAEYTGKVYPSNKYGDVEIVEYINNKRAIIKFINTGYTVEENWSAIRSGYIRDRLLPTTCGFGYIDIEGANIGRNAIREYIIWNGMITRCYNENLRFKHESYKDCHVSEEWRYLSNFKDWCNNQKGFYQDGWHLDKDILVKGNKVYSPETCCFVPPELNCALAGNKSVRGALPQGVTYNSTKTRYRTSIKRSNKWESLGTYDTPEEAFYAYKPVKEAHIKSLAEKWKGKIDSRVYEALMNWVIEITD